MYQYMYALQTVSTTTDDTDYYDQFEQGNIGAQKEIEQVMQMYQTISPEEYLNIQQSKTQMQKLYRQIEDLSNEFSKIAWAKKSLKPDMILYENKSAKLSAKLACSKIKYKPEPIVSHCIPKTQSNPTWSHRNQYQYCRKQKDGFCICK